MSFMFGVQDRSASEGIRQAGMSFYSFFDRKGDLKKKNNLMLCKVHHK